MNSRHLLVLLLFAAPIGVFGQAELTIRIEDGTVVSSPPMTELIVGLMDGASDGFDDFPIDVQSPPFPPAGAFDARILNDRGLVDGGGNTIQGFLEERRGESAANQTFSIQCLPSTSGAGNTCDMSWNPVDAMMFRTMTLQVNPFDPASPLIDMKTQGTATIAQQAIGPVVQPAFGIVVATSIVLPVELTDFSVSSTSDGFDLLWETASESANAGFGLERKGADTNNQFVEIDWIDGAGDSRVTTSYRYELRHVIPGRHQFRLRQVDFDGTTAYSNVVESTLAVPEVALSVAVYPNPISADASIVAAAGRTQLVDIDVYDLLGNKVRHVAAAELSAGLSHRFDLQGGELTPGVYFIRVKGDTTTQTVTAVVR